MSTDELVFGLIMGALVGFVLSGGAFALAALALDILWHGWRNDR